MSEKSLGVRGPDDQLAFIRSKGISAEIVKLQPGQAKTSASAAQAVGCGLAQIAKNIVFSGGRLYLVTLSGDRKVDFEKVSKVVGEKVSLASPHIVLEKLGYPVGGVPPFVHITPIKIIVDRSVTRFDEVFTSGGSEDTLMRISVNDLLKYTGAQVEEVSR